MHRGVHTEHLVEHVYVTVERPPEVPYPPLVALPEQEIQHAVVHETPVEQLHASPSDGVEQVIVDVVNLQVGERTAVHGRHVLTGQVGVGRHLRGYEIPLPRMALQGRPRNFLRPALAVHRGGVEIVYAVGDGVVNEPVYRLLVNRVSVFGRLRPGRPPHAAVAQQRHPAPRLGVGAAGHGPSGRVGAGPSSAARCQPRGRSGKAQPPEERPARNLRAF